MLFSYFLTGHLTAAADNAPNVRLPARFGKRASDGDMMGSNANLMKLMAGEVNGGNEEQQPGHPSSERQFFRNLISNRPSLLSMSTGAAFAEAPAMRLFLLPVSMDSKSNILYRLVSNEAASGTAGLSVDRNGGGPWQ